MPILLDLFSGSLSWSKAFAELPDWECISVDNDAKFTETTIICDVLDWEIPERLHGSVDVVTIGVPCTAYSTANKKKAIVTALRCCCLDLRFLRPARYSRQGGPSAAVRAGRGGGVSPARSCLCLEKPAVLNKIRTSRVCRWGSEQQRKSAHFDGIKIAQKRGHGPHAAYYLHRRAQGRRAPRAHETPVERAASPMRIGVGAAGIALGFPKSTCV